MAKAIIDPTEVRRFAADLRRFTDGMHEQMNALVSRHRSLGQTWRDQEHTKFSDEFEHSMRSSAGFASRSPNTYPSCSARRNGPMTTSINSKAQSV